MWPILLLPLLEIYIGTSSINLDILLYYYYYYFTSNKYLLSTYHVQHSELNAFYILLHRIFLASILLQ